MNICENLVFKFRGEMMNYSINYVGIARRVICIFTELI